MKKRRSVSELNKAMDEINNRKPTAKQIEELAEALNEKVKDTENDGPAEKVASSNYIEKESDAVESNWL